MRPTHPVPPAHRARQLTYTALGSSYAARGLRYVMQRTSAEYRDLLTALADRLRDLVQSPASPPPPAPENPAEPLDLCAVARATPTVRLGASSLPAILPDPASTSTIVTDARPPRPATARHVILFLAANPAETTRLALDEECAAIERELRMTTGRDDFDFRSRWAVSVDEAMRALNERLGYRPLYEELVVRGPLA